MTLGAFRNWRDNLADPRTLLLLAAFALLLVAIALPPIPSDRKGVEFIAVVDITGSMNTRDYKQGGKPVSRLAIAKDALKELIASLPCPSRMGLALFTERVPFLLFEPTDVCTDYGTLAVAIDSIDWREGWQGDSHIAAGLYNAVDLAKSLKSDLVFITDGQEAPPLPAMGGPTFEGKKGDVRGLIVGAGNYELSQIPKFDDRGNEIGFVEPGEVPNESRFGPPPADAESRPGYDARNAPFGGTAAEGTEHLSSVREPYLKSLAEKTGLTYVHMEGSSGLASALEAVGTPHPSKGYLDLRWVPATLAFAALAVLFGFFPIHERIRFARRHRRRFQEVH